jgi:hypothetical protein
MSMHPRYLTEAGRLGTAGPDVRPDAGPNWGTFVEGAVAASIVLPFMQAFASKAGEDAYRAVKSLVKHLRMSPELVSLYDPSTHTKLVFVSPLSDEAIKQLAGITPARLESRVATWDADAGTWRISVLKAPPVSAEPVPSADPFDGMSRW